MPWCGCCGARAQGGSARAWCAPRWPSADGEHRGEAAPLPVPPAVARRLDRATPRSAGASSSGSPPWCHRHGGRGSPTTGCSPRALAGAWPSPPRPRVMPPQTPARRGPPGGPGPGACAGCSRSRRSSVSAAGSRAGSSARGVNPTRCAGASRRSTGRPSRRRRTRPRRLTRALAPPPPGPRSPPVRQACPRAPGLLSPPCRRPCPPRQYRALVRLRRGGGADVKADVTCPENTEVRCPLFTDVRVPWDHPGTPTSSGSAILGFRPNRPAFFFSRTR